MNNDFRKIPSLENRYEVNSDGSVIRNAETKRPLKQFKKSHNSKTEYWCTQVNLHKNIRKVFIHNAVAECWLGEKPQGMQTDHIDRNSLNNDYHNLRYVTKSEQMLNRDYSKFIDKLVVNNLHQQSQAVRLYKNSKSLDFESKRKCAKYLSQISGKKEKSYNDKFYRKVNSVDGYMVEYL